jgi:hypothetical protein
LLAFKLILVPALIVAITLATRRWGPRIGGFLTALPVVTGPTLCFYAIEQGPAFGARAATGTLLALNAVVTYGVVYSRLSVRHRWPLTLVAGWLAFLAAAAALYFVPQSATFGLVFVAGSCLVGARLLPDIDREPVGDRRGDAAAQPSARVATVPLEHPSWDIPLRVVAAVTLVVMLTSVAAWLGPSLSGLLTPFPLATAILAAFTHAQRGSRAVLAFFHGFIPALTSFAVFCFVLAVSLTSLPLGVAIAAALASQLVVQALTYRRHAAALSLTE